MVNKEAPKYTGFWHRTFFRDGVNGTPTAEELGGEDVWEPPNKEPKGCDKQDHFQRSVVHQPNHAKHTPPKP